MSNETKEWVKSIAFMGAYIVGIMLLFSALVLAAAIIYKVHNKIADTFSLHLPDPNKERAKKWHRFNREFSE